MNLRLLLLFLSFSFLMQTAKGSDVSYDVIHYDADIQPSLTDHTISGTVNIHLTSHNNILSELLLDAPELAIEGVWNGKVPQRFEIKDARLLVHLNPPVVPNEVRTLTIRYHGKPTKGIQFFPDHVYTVFSTSRWLVCHDQPDDKASLTLRLTLPADMKVVANGKLVDQKLLPQNNIQYVWRQDMPIPTYTFGFAAGRFNEIVKQDGRVQLRFLTRSYTANEVERIFAGTSEMIAFYEKKSGVPLPNALYTQVLALGTVYQEMSNFTVINENYGREVLAEPKENWIIAHELAHQWWGNSVTCRTWSDFWLNEGMATFISAAFKEQYFGRDEYDHEMEKSRRSYAEIREHGKDRSLVYNGWSKPSEAGGDIIYDKGALVLHLLRFQLGDKAFWAGIRRFTQTNFGGVVVSRDLRRAMEQASGKDLTDFFAHWVYQADTLNLVASHHVEKNELVIELEQHQAGLWAIPLQIAVETVDGRQSRRIMLESKHGEFRFPLSHPPLSVRIDDGGYLPVTVIHQRPVSMLLYQLAHEPDIAGRADALDQLVAVCVSGSRQGLCGNLRAALERSDKDSSRLIRELARQAMKRLSS